MKKVVMFLIMFILLSSLIFISGCAMQVSELQNKAKSLVGEKVVVQGIIKNSVKIGHLSGLTLEDPKTHETIFISTKNLREEGQKVVIKGTLMKELLIGYYILDTQKTF